MSPVSQPLASLVSVGLSELCDPYRSVHKESAVPPVSPLFPGLRLGDGGKKCFSPALPKQPCSRPTASALFWATATGCSPLGPAQAGLSSVWPRVLPADSILGTAIIAGFTYFSLSVVSLMLRGFVSPKGSSRSPFPLELDRNDR